MVKKKKNNKHKTSLSLSSTEDSGEIVKETAVIEFSCPMCKKMLEMKKELKIKK